MPNSVLWKKFEYMSLLGSTLLINGLPIIHVELKSETAKGSNVSRLQNKPT